MTLNRRHLLYGAVGALIAGTVPALGKDSFRLSGRAYGTSWQATLRDSGDLDALARDLAADLARVDLAMSPFRPDSALSRFNLAGAGAHRADADFVAVTAEALRIAALTDGAFDPSVGPDVGRYGFGPIGGKRTGDFNGIATNGDIISKADPELTLDLCGIAKGFALGRV